MYKWTTRGLLYERARDLVGSNLVKQNRYICKSSLVVQQSSVVRCMVAGSLNAFKRVHDLPIFGFGGSGSHEDDVCITCLCCQ